MLPKTEFVHELEVSSSQLLNHMFMAKMVEKGVETMENLFQASVSCTLVKRRFLG